MARILGLACLLCLVDPLFAKEEAVVFVVDPAWDCVSSYVANVPLLQEYKIVKVMTRLGKAPRCNSDFADIYQNITFNSWTPDDSLATEEICPKLQSLGFPVAAVIPTFDPAVYLADRLAACVGARGNPFEGPLAKARRDKWVMSEAVKKAGIRSVHEKLVTSWNEAKDYLESLNPPLSDAHPVIFKILQGSSSEGVNKVYNLKQAEDIFSTLVGTTSNYGDKIGKVLIQEFLQGKEYVIDSVSRDGVHKVVVVWNEDLRPGNGIFNLYYGFKAMDPKDQKIAAIIDYATKVLDATGLKNGASDMEVIWLEEEGTPCVIDLNARWTALMWHDGLAMEEAITGNNQITATVNAYLDGDAFNEMPPVPPMKQNGAMVFAFAHHLGVLRDAPGLAVAKTLPSYFGSYNEGLFPGTLIDKLVSSHPVLFILLAHKSKAVVDEDYDRLIDLEFSDAFFKITPSTGYTSLRALPPGGGNLQGYGLPVIVGLAMLTLGISALAATLRRSLRDSTDYVNME